MRCSDLLSPGAVTAGAAAPLARSAMSVDDCRTPHARAISGNRTLSHAPPAVTRSTKAHRGVRQSGWARRRVNAWRARGRRVALSRRFFDPARYRIVLFDRAGAGKSKPHAELRDNTRSISSPTSKGSEITSVSRVVVFGGSWGSTLALLRAGTPDRVSARAARNLPRRPGELRWFNELDAARAGFPSAGRAISTTFPRMKTRT